MSSVNESDWVSRSILPFAKPLRAVDTELWPTQRARWTDEEMRAQHPANRARPLPATDYGFEYGIHTYGFRGIQSRRVSVASSKFGTTCESPNGARPLLPLSTTRYPAPRRPLPDPAQKDPALPPRQIEPEKLYAPIPSGVPAERGSTVGGGGGVSWGVGVSGGVGHGWGVGGGLGADLLLEV